LGGAGSLDKRPSAHYYAAVTHLTVTCPKKERSMTKMVLTEAASKYFGPRYTQHNPNAPDGPEGFKTFLQFLKEKFPSSRSEIKRVFADGDYVILHVHAVREPGTRGNAIVDIFKLENGKIVEHWDVVQPIPEKAANTNGMF